MKSSSSLRTTHTLRDESSSSQDEFRDEHSTAFAKTIPIDEFQDCMDLDDSDIPTIRLSHLGSDIEQDCYAVQQDLGEDEDENAVGSVADSIDPCELKTGVQKKKGDDSQEVVDASPTPTASEEMVVEDPPPQRQRMVSENGVIAEFDMPSNFHYGYQQNKQTRTSNTNDRSHNMIDSTIVAEAFEIDASAHSGSCLNMHDLELGDEEPLPYPGHSRRPSYLARAARSAISTFTHARTNSTSSRSPFLRLTAPGQHRRAELLSATVIKNSPTEHVGLNLLRDEVAVYSINRDIVATDDDDDEVNASGGSLLRHCPFQPGDKILSINNKRTQNMDSQEAARMLREATGFITIVCQNPDGDPCLIETMITKANKNQRSGMGLKSTGNHDLRVSSINENGLFAQSLLNVGDRILSINEIDVTEVDARVACNIIRDSPDRVTLVARTAHTTGVVVAEVSARGLDQSQQALTDVPEEEPHGNTQRNEIEAVDDDNWAFNRKYRGLGLCLIFVIVAVMLVMYKMAPFRNPK